MSLFDAKSTLNINKNTYHIYRLDKLSQYGQIDKLIATFGDDVNYTYNVDPVAAQLLDPKTLASGLGDLTKEMVKRYKAITGAKELPQMRKLGD